jgi:hypothetical protein
VEAKVQRASQIAQDVLHRSEVILPRIMHMKTNLLDSVGDIKRVNIRYWRAPVKLLN